MDNDYACTEDMILAMEESVGNDCRSFYLQNEIDALREVGRKIAIYECFLQKFEQQCSEFIIY